MSVVSLRSNKRVIKSVWLSKAVQYEETLGCVITVINIAMTILRVLHEHFAN